MEFKTHLSPNLINLPNCIKGKSFRISLKNHPEEFFECPELFACIISEKIAKMKIADPTVNELTISHQKTLQYLNHFYQSMISTRNYSEIIFQNIKDFKNFMEDIESNISPVSINEEISTSNAVNLLQQVQNDYNKNGFYQKVVNFISRNFDDVCNKEYLSIDELEMIFSNKSFQIHSESLLFKFIIQYINEKDENAKVLLSYIEYQNLSVSDIEQFLHIINLDEVNDLLWEKLQSRLLLDFSSYKNIINNNRYIIDSSINYPVIDNQRFKGIFYNLNQKCGGNCSEKDVVDVKCSKLQEYQETSDLTDFDNTGDHSTWIDDQLNGYFEFDFKDKKVVISYYEFQTPESGDDNGYPKNWSIECSDDGKEWFVIDNVRNDEHLHGPTKYHLYEVKQPIYKPCRYVRIYQRGFSHSIDQDYYFGLYFVEFYGKLYE